MLTGGFQYTQTPARGPSSQTIMKDDKLAGVFIEDSHAKTHQKTPMLDSSEESYETLDSSISTISYKMPLKKK